MIQFHPRLFNYSVVHPHMLCCWWKSGWDISRLERMFGLSGSNLLLKRLFSLIRIHHNVCAHVCQKCYLDPCFSRFNIESLQNQESESAHKMFPGGKNNSWVWCRTQYLCASNITVNIISLFPTVSAVSDTIFASKLSLKKNLSVYFLWNHALSASCSPTTEQRGSIKYVFIIIIIISSLLLLLWSFFYLISGSFFKQAENAFGAAQKFGFMKTYIFQLC